MNSCILAAKIVRSPELRYTQNNEMAVTEMMVEFSDYSPNTPPYTLKAVAWGNLAIDINQKYTEGNQVILKGRLKMNIIERQEGFKEKIAELTISQIYPLEMMATNQDSDNVVSLDSYKSEGISDNNQGNFNPPNDDNIPF